MVQFKAGKNDQITALAQKTPATRIVILVFLPAALLLLASLSFMYWMGLRVLKINHFLSTQREIIEKLELFELAAKAAEASQSAFLLTGSQQDFNSYQESRASILNKLQQVRQMAASGDISAARMPQIERLTAENLDKLDKTVNLARGNQREEALAIMRAEKGQSGPSSLQQEFETLKAQEIGEFEDANHKADMATIERNYTFILTTLINLAFLGWACQKLAREMHFRTVAENALLKSHLELEERVKRRTADLEAANRELEAFGYSVSHDLRAPLRHISGYIKLLEKNTLAHLDATSQKHVQIIDQAAQRMEHLIDDLLALSRIGRVTFNEGVVKLDQLVDGVRKELDPDLQGRDVEWEIGSLPKVRGDSSLLRSAMINLLSNAIKFTRSAHPAHIEIGSKEQNGDVVCFVKDNGAGFDMQFSQKLFGVFQRLHDSGEFEGTGIGLASVRRVIQRHGGKTWAEGEVGRGATFFFSIPKERVV